MDWSLPRSEAPETFHTWAGLFTLASVVKRRVKVPKKYLGGWEVSPTIYTIFVAPPGKARKSTTAGYADELLGMIPNISRASTSMTKEVFLKKLADAHENSISVLSSEFAMFIQKSGPDMYDVLTDLFDGKKDISVETLSRGFEFADKPCVNLLAATTPDWISANMPETVIGGGFSSRVIFIFEPRARRYQLFYENLNTEHLDKLKQNLVDDLLYISENIAGDFEITLEGKEFMEEWYGKNAENNPNTNYRLEGYFQRKPAHIFKVAMLLKIAKGNVLTSDDLKLGHTDFKEALKLLELTEKKLPETFKNIGKNEFVTDLERIQNFIAKKGSVTRKELLTEFKSVAEPEKLVSLIGGLIATEDIKLVNKDGTIYYSIV